MNSIVLSANGVRLAVTVAGEGPRTILFIHGFPLDWTIWRPQLEGLRGWRGVAPDLRGMGRSAAPGPDCTMAAYAGDLEAVLDQLGVERATLCGLSMGGYVAFECLRRWRHRVDGLVLMDTRAEPDSEPGRAARDAMIAMVQDQGAEGVAAAMLPKLLRPGIHQEQPGLPEQVLAMMARTPVAGIVGALTAMRDRPDSRPLLPALAGLPTLVLVGEHDTLTPPEVGRAMADAIPGAGFEVVAGAAHLPTLEQPEITTGLLQRFLDGLVEGGVGGRGV